MKHYIITEYPGLVRKYIVEGNNKKDAYNNFLEDKIIEALEDDYFESWNDTEIEEVKQQKENK